MPRGFEKIKSAKPALGYKIAEQCYFVTKEDVEEIAKIDRNILLLVRCGCGRFLTPADSVNHFVDVINSSEHEYVRDVSFQAE